MHAFTLYITQKQNANVTPVYWIPANADCQIYRMHLTNIAMTDKAHGLMQFHRFVRLLFNLFIANKSHFSSRFLTIKIRLRLATTKCGMRHYQLIFTLRMSANFVLFVHSRTSKQANCGINVLQNIFVHISTYFLFEWFVYSFLM